MKRININKEKLISLYNSGLTMYQIADILEVGIGTVHRNFKRLGIKSKTLSQYPQWNKGKHYMDDNRILHGINHPRIKNKSYYTAEFKVKRLVLLKNGKCFMCARKAELVHHVDFDKMNNKDNNLATMCNSCHTTLHNIARGNRNREFKARQKGDYNVK